MRHGLVFLGILIAVGLAAWYDLSPATPIKEGLDLKGGMRVVLEADHAEIARKKLNIQLDRDTMTQVKEIMENEYGFLAS